MARGLFRLWLVTTAVWALVAESIMGWSNPWNTFYALVVIPSGLVFLAGLGLLWAARGFRQG